MVPVGTVHNPPADLDTAMRTFLLVKLTLLPIVLYGLLAALGAPRLATLFAAVSALVLVIWRLARGLRRPMEETLAAGFVALVLLDASGHGAVGHTVPALLAALGLVGLGLALCDIAWTEPYARAQHAEVSQTKAFHIVNLGLSVLWSAIFLLVAALAYVGVGHMANWLPLGVGVAVTAIAPRLAERWYRARAIQP